MNHIAVETRAGADRVPVRARPPYGACALIGLGGLFAGVTGPLLSTFVPLLVREVLGDRRTAIGAVMAIDNVLLLALVPLAGVLFDRTAARGGGRLSIVMLGFGLAALGMALFPQAPAFGLAGIVAAMVVLYSGINIQRSPLQALVADLVPSAHRSLATGSVLFQMCVGAIVFLMLGRALGMRTAFLVAAATVVAIGAVMALGIREPHRPTGSAVEATHAAIGHALRDVLGGRVPGLRAVFVATCLLQLTFQTFSTWFALHAAERFGLRGEDVAMGFIAWAIGGVIGALPAGMIGVRLGRRGAILLGFACMAATLLALSRVSTFGATIPLLALASASWTLPSVNAYPLFIEPIPRVRRGVVAALFLLSMALGGTIGDPLNGALFDAAGGYGPLFVLMAAYSALACLAVLRVPRGAGEASTGVD